MLKRTYGSSVVLKRHRSSVEFLPHDVVELIMERIAAKSLLRLRFVSKNWRSTVDSQRFRERHLIRRRKSRGPDVFYLTFRERVDEVQIVLGSSIVRTVKFPFLHPMACHGTCDGLVCLYSYSRPNVVFNPATPWFRGFPFSCFQRRMIDMFNREEINCPPSKLGFGKDKIRNTYKPVWLYNSSVFGLDTVTTCEVYDFSTDAWRYIVPASPYRILRYQKPVHLDGSLYWLTECVETKVLSFDLHTETFQVIAKAPFANVLDPLSVILCILDNRLCVSEKIWPTQEIWSLDSSSANKTWKKMCSTDCTKTYPWYRVHSRVPLPVAILDKNKLLLQGREDKEPLVLHDLHTKSYDLVFKPPVPGQCVCYYDSLLSIKSN